MNHPHRGQGPAQGNSIVPRTTETPGTDRSAVPEKLGIGGIGHVVRSSVRGFLPANVGMMLGSSIGFSLAGGLPISSWVIVATGLSLGFDAVQVAASLRKNALMEVSTRRSLITGFFATLAVGSGSLLSGVTDPVLLFLLGLGIGGGLAGITPFRGLKDSDPPRETRGLGETGR